MSGRPKASKAGTKARVKGFAKRFLGGFRSTPASLSRSGLSGVDQITSGPEAPSGNPPLPSSGGQAQHQTPRQVHNDQEPTSFFMDDSSSSQPPIPPVIGRKEFPYINYGPVTQFGNAFTGNNFELERRTELA
ncbi:hypothetical protein BKA70DRAFT_1242106 [Coprinopsis sp. MPI-PUGE-AT-0042]|nr:hypothetical protein BKA70DRAFT_1242106 [Coprinopsis sp. MPI-PUGE-AT-0042]